MKYEMNTDSGDMTRQLSNDVGEVFVMIDTYALGSAPDERIWIAMESLHRIITLIHKLPDEALCAVLDSPEYLAEANQGMIDWSESVEPSGGWPKELLARLQKVLDRN